MFPVYTICHSIGKCVSSDAWIPCAWVCDPAATFHPRNICSMSCIWRVCPSDGNENATADLRVVKKPFGSQDVDIYRVCRRYACVCAAVDAIAVWICAGKSHSDRAWCLNECEYAARDMRSWQKLWNIECICRVWFHACAFACAAADRPWMWKSAKKKEN